jgi:hypothetical protein
MTCNPTILAKLVTIDTTNNSNNSMTTEILEINMIEEETILTRKELLTIWLGSRDLIIRITMSYRIISIVVLSQSSTGVRIVKDREERNMMNI